MNENFKKLHVEATAYAKNLHSNNIVEFTVVSGQKLGELIIAECIRAAMKAKSLEAAGLIADHFGIPHLKKEEVKNKDE